MLSRISDILEKGADLLEVESAVAFQRLLRLGAAIAFFLGLVVICAAGVLSLAAAAILTLEEHTGLIPALLSAGLVMSLVAGAGIWFVWRRTKRHFEHKPQFPSVEDAKRQLRESITRSESQQPEAGADSQDPLAARVIENIMKHPEMTAAAGAAILAAVGPTRVLRGIGRTAGAISGCAAIFRIGREMGFFGEDTTGGDDRHADNGQARSTGGVHRNRGAKD